MKPAIAVILSGCALAAIALPASADRASLQRSVKLCEAELDRMTPALKRHRVDYDESASGETQMRLVFKGLDADGSFVKLSCLVDRETRAVSVTRARPRQADDATFASREWRATP